MPASKMPEWAEKLPADLRKVEPVGMCENCRVLRARIDELNKRFKAMCVRYVNVQHEFDTEWDKVAPKSDCYPVASVQMGLVCPVCETKHLLHFYG